MSDNILARVSHTLATEHSLESLVRQLLEMIELVTNMESTYLTVSIRKHNCNTLLSHGIVVKSPYRRMPLSPGMNHCVKERSMKTTFSVMTSAFTGRIANARGN